ncbi:MAG: TonB-dependent receptor [Rhodoferax sp.]|nr:TonB-dependent receptor [Rhodoferax sp.]
MDADSEDLVLSYGDKSFVSIATGTKQLLRKSPSTATVITAEDIVAMGATTVDEALESVPGLHVSRSTIYGPHYGIRGILTDSNPHVLMMVNGVPLTSVFQGNRNDIPVSLPTANVARIEVIRGPGSALYGADAFAGTINIITKTAEELQGPSVGLRAGSFDSVDTWFQYGGKVGALDVAAYLSAGRTSGQRRTVLADKQTELDSAVSLAPGSVNLRHDDVDAQIDVGFEKFRLHAGYTLRDNVGVGVGIAGALDPVGKIRTARFTSDLAWTDANFAPDLSLTLQAAYMHMANEILTPMVIFPSGAFSGSFPNGMVGAPNKWEQQLRLSISGDYSGFSDHHVRMGIGSDTMEIYKTNETKNFIFSAVGAPLPLPMYSASGANLYLSPHDRNVNYLYAQDEWGFARDWTLTGGVRYDQYSDFGNTTNPRLTLVWEARQNVTTKLMYGTAFRAPSFVELYAAGNPVALGNPKLTPEKIRTLEGAVSWQVRHNVETSLSLFRHEISDLIAVSGTGTPYQNTGKQDGHGGEWELTWDPSRNLRLSGHYAYQKNVDQTTQQDSGYAPHRHLYGRADWRFASDWFISGQLNWVAERKRAAGDARPEVPDYTSVDVTLRADRSRQGWDFLASIRNLLDADIREPSKMGSGITFDLPMPGRTLWLQVRYSL